MSDQKKGLWADSFAERFKEISDGKTYRELSDMLSISKSTAHAYVTGDRVPKVDALNTIAEKFNVNPMWLMGADVPKYERTSSDFPAWSDFTGNIVKVAGRDGSFVEKQLSDKQMQALKSFLDLLPDASDDL